jgi:hypothetical protein
MVIGALLVSSRWPKFLIISLTGRSLVQWLAICLSSLSDPSTRLELLFLSNYFGITIDFQILIKKARS